MDLKWALDQERHMVAHDLKHRPDWQAAIRKAAQESARAHGVGPLKVLPVMEDIVSAVALLIYQAQEGEK